jgi:quercetin dioxygenase-like cupin family protein
MRNTRAWQRFAFACATLVMACGDSTREPTAIRDVRQSDQSQHSMHQATVNVAPLSVTPFTVRAPLDPYQLHQLPDFLMHSKARTDIVIQQLVFTPGAGPWHTHPGPSFVYVVQGEIKLERVTGKGCVETPVFTPGQAYFEVGNQVHRAVVVSSVDAVLFVTRFNVPVGAPITVPAATPNC